MAALQKITQQSVLGIDDEKAQDAVLMQYDHVLSVPAVIQINDQAGKKVQSF
jgi:hypothetical protein